MKKTKEELGLEYYQSNASVSLQSTFCAGHAAGKKEGFLLAMDYFAKIDSAHVLFNLKLEGRRLGILTDEE